MKTGRDVVIATLLGAEEYGFATAPLIVERLHLRSDVDRVGLQQRPGPLLIARIREITGPIRAGTANHRADHACQLHHPVSSASSRGTPGVDVCAAATKSDAAVTGQAARQLRYITGVRCALQIPDVVFRLPAFARPRPKRRQRTPLGTRCSPRTTKFERRSECRRSRSADSLAAFARQWAESLLKSGKFSHRPKNKFGRTCSRLALLMLRLRRW